MNKIIAVLTVILLIVSIGCFSVSAETPSTYAVHTWADDEFPNVYDVWTDRETYPYALIYNRQNPRLVFAKKKPFYTDTGRVEVPSGGYLQYDIATDENGIHHWEYTSKGSLAFIPTTDLSVLVWSSVDIADNNGNVQFSYNPNFLKAPMWVKVEMATEGQMMETIPKLGATMKIIVLCGIGCLALLIGLSLFGKKSLIFLQR